MNETDLQGRLKELYLPPADEFVWVDVPEMRYVMIDGQGAADRTGLDLAVKWLFTAIHPIKKVARERMGKNFVEPPLEGLWWAEDMRDFIRGNRAKLEWRMMIVFEPDWLTKEMLDDGIVQAQKRLGAPPDSLRLESYREGRCVQIMHLGLPAEQVALLKRLHGEFLPAHNLIPKGRHHEIYLTDPNRTAPEKMKTVLRQPVQSAS